MVQTQKINPRVSVSPNLRETQQSDKENIKIFPWIAMLWVIVKKFIRMKETYIFSNQEKDRTLQKLNLIIYTKENKSKGTKVKIRGSYRNYKNSTALILNN